MSRSWEMPMSRICGALGATATLFLSTLAALPVAASTETVNGWFAYNPAFSGGVHVTAGDVDSDPAAEVITGAGPGGTPRVRVFDADGAPVAAWNAYGTGFAGGVYVAAGNVDDDPEDEVITGAGPGGGPHVVVWDVVGDTASPKTGVYAYTPGFTGGVRVTTGDVDGTDGGRDEVITAPGPGGGPHLRILDPDVPGWPSLADTFVYASGFTGGVWPGAGDTDGDGRDEVITGPGPGGGPHVRVFDAHAGVVPVSQFFAYAPAFAGGVRVAAGDVNGGGDEVLTGAGPGAGAHVRAVTASGAGVEGFVAYPGFGGGVFVAAGDGDGDGDDEIITGAGAGGGPHVKIVDLLQAPTPAVSTFVGGSDVERAWDLAFLPAGELVWTEFFSGEVKLRTTDGVIRSLATVPNLFVGSEAGLMGLTVDPAFAANRRIYICRAWTDGGSSDIRVEAWTVSADLTTATPASGTPVLVSGIPNSTGRHAGCRLLVDADGWLRITTGDAAIGTTPQALGSLGGKTLRVDRFSGAAAPSNPFVGGSPADDPVFTYGHRNPQGLARRPGTAQYFAAEHGPDRDDEVNLLQAGGNYGWDPVPGYNEGVPMTDLAKFPSAVPARWSSGSPTTATSGATFVTGSQWEGWDGALVIANLKAQRLIVLTLDAGGFVTGQSEALAGSERLRSLVQGPDGNLYVTTSNSSGNRILRVTPS